MWTKKDDGLQLIKSRLSSTPLLALPKFTKDFEIETNASIVGTVAILSQVKANCLLQ